MKMRHNMAYRAPSSTAHFGMTAGELRAAAASGDAGAQAELDRRAANRKDPTTKAGQRQMKWDATKAAREAAEAAKPKSTAKAAQRAQAVERAAEQGKLTDADLLAAQRGYLSDEEYEARKAKNLEDLRTLQRAGKQLYGNGRVRHNGLPYPRATVLYPQVGIVQGGTGPFYGPTGTLFDRTPDLLWEYKNNPEILWPRSASDVGVIQGGSRVSRRVPTETLFDRTPNFTKELRLNRKRRSR